jgi:hypothetical protein
MSAETLTFVLTGIMGGWLLTLSLLFASVVRHLGAMEATLVTASKGEQFDFAADGPELMSELPRGVVRVLAEHGVDSQAEHVVFFASAGCGPCLDRAKEYSQSHTGRNGHLVTLISGQYAEGVDELRQLLGGVSTAFITDPDAREVVKLANINSTPFIFRIANGKVIDKRYVGSARDIEKMTIAATPAAPSPN